MRQTIQEDLLDIICDALKIPTGQPKEFWSKTFGELGVTEELREDIARLMEEKKGIQSTDPKAEQTPLDYIAKLALALGFCNIIKEIY